MNPLFEELTPWLDRAYALNSALVLMEWDCKIHYFFKKDGILIDCSFT